MIRLIAFAAFALALATSAQAMPLAPLHQPDGMSTQVRYYGYGHRRYGYRHYGYRQYGYYGTTATAAMGTTAIGTTAIGHTAMASPVESRAAISAEESSGSETLPEWHSNDLTSIDAVRCVLKKREDGYVMQYNHLRAR